MSRERDLLFGILAMRLGKVIPDQLEDESGSLEESLGGLGQSLVRSGILTEQDRESLVSMVDDAIRSHNGDARAALASLGGEAVLLRTVAGTMPSFDELATIASTPGEGGAATMISAGGVSPGAGGEGLVPAVPEHPGRYDEIRAFAAGGMGKIWLMHDRHLGRDVALKQLLPERLGHATQGGAPTADLLTIPIIARFLQEARVTGQLEHPSIVPVYELGYRADGSLYYTMKLVRGKSMQEALDDAPDLGARLKLLTHFLDLCYAIAYAHSRKVIHRDLKPLNIMLGEFGETVVIDWGIAKVRGLHDIHAKGLTDTVRTMRVGDAEATSKTEYGQTIGSPYYMPPEQAEGDPEKVDERSDVYALGAVLYTILAGQPPYKGMKVREFLEKVMDFDPKPIREVEANAPLELCAVVERAMARDPDDRYPDARALVDEVQQFLSGGLVSAYEYNFTELARRFIKRHKRVLSTAAIAAVVLLATGVYSYFSIRAQRNIAIDEERKARIAEGEAKEARDEAVIAQEQAEIARDEALQQLYYARVGQVQSAINERLLGNARETLASAPAANRDWEWGHLLQLVNADTMTLATGGSRFAFAGEEALVACTKGGTIRVVDRASGAPQRTLLEKGGTGFAFATSAGGTRTAAAAEGGIQVWDTATGAVLFSFDDPAPSSNRRFLDLSADGKRVGALCSDRSARVWDVETGETRFERRVDQARGFGMYFSPTGARVVIAQSVFGANGFEPTFEVFDLDSGASLGAHAMVDPNSAHSVAWGPGGRHFAVGTDNELQLWTLEPFAQQHRFDLRFGFPGTIAFSPGGEYLAAGSTDGNIGLWNVATGKGGIVAKAHPDQVRTAAFSPDGTLFATGSDDTTVGLWSVPALTPLHVYRGHESAVFAVAFSPDGAALASGAFDGQCKLWDLRDELSYRAAGDKLAYSVNAGLLAGLVGTDAAVWDLANGHRVRTLPLNSREVAAIALSAGGRLAATAVKSADNQHRVDFWDANGAALGTFSTAPTIKSMTFAGNETILLQMGSSLEVRAVPAGDLLRDWATIEGFAVAPDGAHLAVAIADPDVDSGRIVDVFRINEDAPVATWRAASATPLTLVFSKAGQTLVAGGRETDSDAGFAASWPWAEGADAERIVLPGALAAYAEHPDTGRRAFGGRDIVLYGNGPDPITLSGHDGGVVSLDFSPDGARIVSASQDGTFKIWDAANGREILTLHSSATTAAGQVILPEFTAFGSGGAWLLTLTNAGVPPVVLRAFPHDETVFEGDADASLQERVERFKRKRGGGQ